MSDTISRQAAIRWVKAECNPYGKPTLDYESGKRVMKHLEQMLPAQPERKRGKWKSYRCDMYKCSECGYIYTELTDLHRCVAKYCPNCGADMREDEQK